jgi:hypothetical protein
MNRRLFCGGLLGFPALFVPARVAEPHSLTFGTIRPPPEYDIPAVRATILSETYHPDSTISRNEMVRLMKIEHERTVRAIADEVRRGGSYKRAFRT